MTTIYLKVSLCLPKYCDKQYVHQFCLLLLSFTTSIPSIILIYPFLCQNIMTRIQFVFNSLPMKSVAWSFKFTDTQAPHYWFYYWILLHTFFIYVLSSLCWFKCFPIAHFILLAYSIYHLFLISSSKKSWSFFLPIYWFTICFYLIFSSDTFFVACSSGFFFTSNSNNIFFSDCLLIYYLLICLLFLCIFCCLFVCSFIYYSFWLI